MINYLWFERRKRNLRLFKFVARPLGGEIFEFYSADNTPDTNTNVKTNLEHKIAFLPLRILPQSKEEMADEKVPKETEQVKEFKLEQDHELRFEVEGKEKVTIEVCINYI